MTGAAAASILATAAVPAAASFDWSAVRGRLLAELYRFVAAAPLLLLALLLTLAAWWFGGWLARRALIDRLAGANPFLKNLLATTLRGGCALLGLAVGLQLMNATAIVGALLGTAGVVGIALGFAFKDIIENYIAGVLLSLRQPFRPHDHVRIAEHEGLVMAMTARATVLMTLDGNQLRVPNAIVFKSVILNFSQNPSRRFEFDLSAPFDGALEATQARIRRRVEAVDGVLREPDAEVLLVSSGDGKAGVRVRGWIDQGRSDIDQVRSAALRAATAALQADAAAPAPAAAARPGAPERTRQHLLRAGEAGAGSRDLLDPAAPAE
ncbi:mechanosensitive ion channel [Lysobacter yananisis]|uniref:Small-conductance mechanosensitive channel n=1 Tax=Lysobacter yananisis TaxID=1003114 RepID=A0ABY9PHM2_9GAMM|nr:mechanosensitive ion channel domain-containing protein [Lysobacter yananisis]WMT05711.1 mechanosensitive ion channel [Lysobacter yananisis]